ncbi:MAG: hypothetical protein IJT00_01785 [Lachnospiraceae bacterium]|nr:hypothetical protein [Lachnospiraceae bacterium]
MIRILIVTAVVIAVLFALLFCIYFFNLDMKFIVNVVAPLFEKHYDNRKNDQYV